MYVISSKGIPADITGGDDVATRKYAPAVKAAAASSEVSTRRDVGSMACDAASHSLRERLGYVRNPRSLIEGTETLCRDDIGDLLGSHDHL